MPKLVRHLRLARYEAVRRHVHYAIAAIAIVIVIIGVSHTGVEGPNFVGRAGAYG